ncbi:hydroxylase [Nocardia neocaledoniensis NBRC 108232]|uniref:2-polyprenyl-6-methoxyphenol hydroxylase-like FAD-dependent oxidoreductase n=1 Tax=Nocardia neocaledoniensis TaxID=236511 RepID=A0A317N8Z0_9NOCA|nr:2-polyprenyl-6-methoxyphenol hydroxylase-like oxidoreductase [Nocardia neocaledoniensis]PWV71776.1 2-polyprenyl-6-methoxyphenol hydroxylase-like FAD-dependent oxidoreductase [Nocardia neocaledoniensis]GEM33052.1 hydroxylase [Nocardia neocaledoniensis NBRC 108232]
MVRRGEHAVVLGASLGGLLAARVLSEFFDRVTVVERDRLGDGREFRRGVPQARHVHALLPSGSQAMETLFPGLLAELAAHGTKVISDYTEFFFSIAGHRLSAGADPRVLTYLPTRRQLESRIRERVAAISAVCIADGRDVVGLVSDRSGGRIAGVRVMAREPGSTEELVSADLVVDATGRGTRVPAWLTALGHEAPAEDTVAVHVGYSSTRLRLSPGSEPEKIVLIGPTPSRPTGMALLATEDESWLFTATGYGNHRPGDTVESMVDGVAGFAPPHVVEALRAAEPLAPVAGYRYEANRRRRYDRSSRPPGGLIALGDALCGFNPIYAQGMSVTALEALALRESLRAGRGDLERRYFRAAARIVEVAWELAVGQDLTQPLVEGPRPLRVRLVNKYVRRLLEAGEHDPVVAARFLRVSAFVDAPASLLRPDIFVRTVFRSRRHPDPVPVPAALTR